MAAYSDLIDSADSIPGQLCSQNLTELRRTGQNTATGFSEESKAEIENLTALATNVLRGTKSIVELREKLSLLKDEVTQILSGNVKV